MAVRLVNTATVFDNPNLLLAGAFGVTSVLVGGVPYLYVSGFADSGISAFSISGTGQLINVASGNLLDNGVTAFGGPTALASVTAGSNAFLYAAGYNDGGISGLTLNPANGGITAPTDPPHNIRDVDSSIYQLQGAIDLVSVTIGGSKYLYAAGVLDNGISTFFVNPTTGALTAGAGAAYHWADPAEPGAGFHTALEGVRALATAVVGGTTYLFAAATIDSAFSAFTVAPTGALTPYQTILDNAMLRIGGASAIATASVGGNTYIFVGGGEDGISVFLLPPGGFINNVFNLGDDATLHLDNVTDLSTASIGGTTYLFAAGHDDDGVSVFRVAADGSLANVANVSDTGALALNGAESLSTMVIGGRTFLAVTGFDDSGVSLFRLDLVPPLKDFNGDGHSDILWQNDNGTVSVWDSGQLGGAHIISSAGVVPASWHISGKGDFDGNGRTDILWQNDDGKVSIWDNGQVAGAHIVAGTGIVPNSWHIAGTGDFDGNGHDDILWRNDDGKVSIWDDGQITGAHVIASAGVVPGSWHIAGTGDFDGNGQDDILWQNDNGAVSIWDNGQLAGAHVIASAGALPSSWHIAGTGDFDGNTRDDILWRNDNGAVSIWDNGQIAGAHIVASAGLVPGSWHIADTGDYDGNGRVDILWRNDNGSASIWDNGLIGGAHIIATISNDWHIA
ncbi:VCBS repeat-containing protein [Bradyrhizobium sp. WSM 1704]|uniref:FG-GAP repeat domain-containing protein n=1 Tax=Bradyrhizobium semiaridum TaxID=2821404 RepID=UPI001CE29FA1|nr:VCBS repeat-containing protein [Bradyrhizobium semiaridum]MCA6125822.1 VCBS repeat-containing protein [Bradyrhizobium semiaridum]